MLLMKKENIEAWLKEYEIRSYELIKDDRYGYIVNVNSEVDLESKN